MLTSGSILAAFVLLGYFNGLCGFRIVASRLPSDAVTLFTNKTSGRISVFPSTLAATAADTVAAAVDVDVFRLLFNGPKKYFGLSFDNDDSFSFDLSG